jgi:DNA-binding transcriptional regulator YdaS (Cro superfamily)
MTKFALTIGVSKQLVAAMVAGERPVSAKTVSKVLRALEEEVARLQKARARLDEIRATMARRAEEK